MTLEVDQTGSDQRFKVKASSGREWWYAAKALKLVDEDVGSKATNSSGAPAAGPQVGSIVTAISGVGGAPAFHAKLAFSAGKRLEIVKVMQWQNAWYATSTECETRWFPLRSSDWHDGGVMASTHSGGGTVASGFGAAATSNPRKPVEWSLLKFLRLGHSLDARDGRHGYKSPAHAREARPRRHRACDAPSRAAPRLNNPGPGGAGGRGPRLDSHAGGGRGSPRWRRSRSSSSARPGWSETLRPSLFARLRSSSSPAAMRWSLSLLWQWLR
jgi:hypothetical protein